MGRTRGDADELATTRHSPDLERLLWVWQAVVRVVPYGNCSAPVVCAKSPLQIWAKPPFATGAAIAVDEVEIFKLG